MLCDVCGPKGLLNHMLWGAGPERNPDFFHCAYERCGRLFDYTNGYHSMEGHTPNAIDINLRTCDGHGAMRIVAWSSTSGNHWTCRICDRLDTEG